MLNEIKKFLIQQEIGTFFVLIEASTFSASLGWSQKLGPMVISCSFCIASSLVSMSKMPPQGSCSIPQIVDLFFSHEANIEKASPKSSPKERTFIISSSPSP